MRAAIHAGQLLQRVPGGIGRYTTALLGHLPDAGVEPVAFAAGRRPPAVPAPVPWVDLGRPHGSFRYELWHRARRPVVRLDVDLVHAPSLAIPPVDPTTPLAVTVHDIAFERVPGVTTRRGTSFHRRGLELARQHATIVLAPSEFTRRELTDEGFVRERVVVTPLGVNPPLPRDPGEVDGTVARAGVHSPYVLTVGTIEPRKDLPTLVAAVDRQRTRRPDLTLVVVGPRGWGAVAGLDRPWIRVAGELPWRVLDALYRRAAACCITSRYEGFGLPAVEALARGTPVIAAAGSALTEVVGDSGLLFPVGDVDALSDAIARVFDDETLRAELARRGRARADELTWARSAIAHAEVFREALARHHRAVRT